MRILAKIEQRDGKMSASRPETSIFTTDPPETVKQKIWQAYTGGKATTKEQKTHGGETDVCSIFQYFTYMFEEEDIKLSERKRKCLRGEILCGECKQDLADKINKFLGEHQKKREKAKNLLPEFNLSR